MTPNHDDNKATLSIGSVSKATGIPVETLRTWERRYGFPKPQRSGSGHRRYHASVVAHLKLTSKAIEQGHRPVNVVGESVETLKVLLDLVNSAELVSVPEPVVTPTPARAPVAEQFSEVAHVSPAISRSIIDAWMDTTMRLDAEGMQRSLESTWYRVGAMPFLNELLSPFLGEIGHAWFEGRIAVLHEQFASNQLRKFLSNQWRPLSERARGPRVVCTTLPGEYHAIGLHMVSVVVAMLGCQVVFLGIDTPLETIADSLGQAGSSVVLLSVSAAANATTTREQVSTLRRLVGDDSSIVIGGAGAPDGIPGVLRFADLHRLSEWARAEYMSA